jgi:predicted RNA-binding protein with PUA-like domain
MPNHWLVKSEPGSYSWNDLVKDRTTAWTGVRNFQARNNLRAMRKDDPVLYYHSGDEKQAVGLARVVREAYPDPTAREGDWSAVDIAAFKPLTQPVALSAIKSDKTLCDLLLVRNSRLSVSPVTPGQFRRLLQLAGSTA